MKEHVQHWKHIEGLAAKYSMECVSDTPEGIRIELSDELDSTKKIAIFFKKGVGYYRFVRSYFRKRTLDTWAREYGSSFYEKWTFFKIIHSQSLAWLSEESCGIRGELKMQHFVFITSNAMVEIIHTFDPFIEPI